MALTRRAVLKLGLGASAAAVWRPGKLSAAGVLLALRLRLLQHVRPAGPRAARRPAADTPGTGAPRRRNDVYGHLHGRPALGQRRRVRQRRQAEDSRRSEE